MTRQDLLVRATWAGVLAVAMGCGSSTPETEDVTDLGNGGSDQGTPTGPVNERGDDSAVATVGPAGGTLSLSNGALLEVPQGALAEPVEIIFGRGTQTQAFSNREDERTIGPTLIIQPAVVAEPGTRIRISAPLVSIPGGFSESDLALAVEEADDSQRSDVMGTTTTRWQYADASVSGGRMRAELESLGGFRVQFVVSR